MLVMIGRQIKQLLTLFTFELFVKNLTENFRSDNNKKVLKTDMVTSGEL